MKWYCYHDHPLLTSPHRAQLALRGSLDGIASADAVAAGTSEVGDADGGADLSSSMIVGAAGGEATLCACRTAGRSSRGSVSGLSVAARIAR